MAKVEIDELEYNENRRLRDVVTKLMADPRRAAKMEELRKEIEPNAPTPHLDQLKLSQEPVEAANKRITDLEKKLAEEKAENEKNSKLSALQARVDAGNARLLQEGWTADGLKALTEFREKEGILDPVHAAAVYEKINGPVAQPVHPSSGFGGWNFLDPPEEGAEADNLKKLLETRGENDALAMKMAHDALSEFRNQVKGR